MVLVIVSAVNHWSSLIREGTGFIFSLQVEVDGLLLCASS